MGMRGDDDWEDRLLTAIAQHIAQDGSYRKISLDAGLSENYVQQFVRYGKVPSVEQFLKLCQALNVSSTYIFTGFDITPGAEDTLRQLLSLPEETRQHYAELLRALHKAVVAQAPSNGANQSEDS